MKMSTVVIQPTKHLRAYDLTPKRYVEATWSRHVGLIPTSETSKIYLQTADEAEKRRHSDEEHDAQDGHDQHYQILQLHLTSHSAFSTNRAAT
jgi:hypothetical protein